MVRSGRRRSRNDPPSPRPEATVLGWEETNTAAHEERLDAVVSRLHSADATTVADLGCGAGALLRRLAAEPRVRRVIGVDSSARALAVAQSLLAPADGEPDPRVTLLHGSITDMPAELKAIDAVTLVETIEHIEPSRLGVLERNVFARLRPRLCIITTPNHEYNALHGLADGEYRHPDHRFEWDRRRFEEWAAGVGTRHGYDVAFEGIGPANAWYGSSTQMAVFERIAR
jgi:small RNA 2'-O-methyltransferase